MSEYLTLSGAPMGSPSHGGGVSQLNLPTPFSPIFVCPAYQNLSPVLLFTHQPLPTYLQFSSLDCPFCLHRLFIYISLLYKPSFATSLFLCSPLETRHFDRVPRPVSLEDGILVIEATVGLRTLSVTLARTSARWEVWKARPDLQKSP